MNVRWINFFLFLSDKVRAYDKVWFIGDEFMDTSFQKHFLDICNEDGKANYMTAHYDVTGFSKSTIFRGFGNAVSKIRNQLVKAINEQILLPKAILIVADDDILDALDHYQAGITVGIGKIVKYLANQLHWIVTAHKEKLPTRS